LAEQQRIARERFIAEEQRAAEERRWAEERRRAEEQRAAEAERRAAEERQKALAAEREAEHQRLTERLLQREEERKARERAGDNGPMGLGARPPVAQAPPAAAPSFAAATPTTRVTVLLVMDPGTTGIRRYGLKTADPVLCTTATCWVGAGIDRSATVMRRGQALGSGNTLGRRAAACNHHLACAFRDIDLKAPVATVQPIDLRILRHDRREFLKVEADPTCRLSRGALTCEKTYTARTWRAWVVPEALAIKAGPSALEAALAGGLAEARPSAVLIPTDL
jgi:hypothetical protein